MADQSHQPVSPLPATRLPFYYGWIMLPVTVVGTFAVSPGQTFGIAEFKGALLRDLALSETQLSALYMVATFLAGLMALVAGAAMDRFGLRRAITISVILLGVSCVFASGVSGVVSVFVAFLLLRVFGHGVLPLMVGNTLAMWFRRRLGFVTGIVGVGSAAAVAGVPALYLWLINTLGWRQAWIVVGLVTCLIMLPIMAFVFRNRPDDVGQFVDGDSCPDEGGISKPAGPDVAVDDGSFDLAGARRTGMYWCLLGLHLVHGMVFAAVMFHRVQIFESHRLTAGDSAVMFAIFCACSAVAQLVAGSAADRVPLNRLLAGSSACVAAALVVLINMDSILAAYAFGGLYGLGTGTEIVGRNTAWPICFGTRHLGKIKGRAVMVTVIGSSLGPFIVGVSFDQFGGYNPAVWMLTAVYGVITLAMVLVATPQRVSGSRGEGG